MIKNINPQAFQKFTWSKMKPKNLHFNRNILAIFCVCVCVGPETTFGTTHSL